MSESQWLSLLASSGLEAFVVSVSTAGLTAVLGWVAVRHLWLGRALMAALQGIAAVPAVLLALGLLVPFQVATLSTPPAETWLFEALLFTAVVTLTALPPGIQTLRRLLTELEDTLGLVARSRGWGRSRLLGALVLHPTSLRIVRNAAGSSLIHLANLELLLGFMAEIGLGDGLGHRGWGQWFIRLREPSRYGLGASDTVVLFAVCVGLALTFYGLGAWLGRGEGEHDAH